MKDAHEGSPAWDCSSKPGPAWGSTTKSELLWEQPGLELRLQPLLPHPGTGTGGCFSSRLLLEEQPGLRSWPLPFQRLPALGASGVQSPHSGRSEKVPRGLRHRATSGRDLLSLDSTAPSCQEGSRLAKEHKASVPSGLLGIFSAKSPISPEQNPEAGRPGGGGGESCCSTAATPWCSVTGSCSPWHQDLCRKVLQASSAVRILFLLPPPLPLIPFSAYKTLLALYLLSYPGGQHASAPQTATVLPAGIR